MKVNKNNLYYILPTQRYDLTTSPPSQTMQNDFTFWLKFKVNKKIKTDSPCSLMMRPGMHYGLCYNQESNAINWEFWYDDSEGNNRFNMESVVVVDEFNGKTLFDTEWLVIVRHNLSKKTFTMNVYDDIHKINWVNRKVSYDGVLKDFSGTPYNFGCANYFKQVGSKHYFFSDYNIYNCGLMENITYTDKELILFLETTSNDTYELNVNHGISVVRHDGLMHPIIPPKLDLIFYFNFNSRSLYKIWDLSDHCNFLQLNMDLGK